jgi:hypothetical protein
MPPPPMPLVYLCKYVLTFLVLGLFDIISSLLFNRGTANEINLSSVTSHGRERPGRDHRQYPVPVLTHANVGSIPKCMWGTMAFDTSHRSARQEGKAIGANLTGLGLFWQLFRVLHIRAGLYFCSPCVHRTFCFYMPILSESFVRIIIAVSRFAFLKKRCRTHTGSTFANPSRAACALCRCYIGCP